jgi:hypothetical protein
VNGVWGAFGGHLGAIGGQFWGRWGAFWGHLNIIWGWGAFGGAFGVRLGGPVMWALVCVCVCVWLVVVVEPTGWLWCNVCVGPYIE